MFIQLAVVVLLLLVALVLARPNFDARAVYVEVAVTGAHVRRRGGDVTLTYEFAQPLPALPPGTSAHLMRFEVPGAAPTSRGAQLAAALTERRGVPFRVDGSVIGLTTVSTNAVPAAAAALLGGSLVGIDAGGRGVMRFHIRSA